MRHSGSPNGSVRNTKGRHASKRKEKTKPKSDILILYIKYYYYVKPVIFSPFFFKEEVCERFF